MSNEEEITPETTAAAEASEPTEALTEDLSADAQPETAEVEAADAPATEEATEASAKPKAARKPAAKKADEKPAKAKAEPKAKAEKAEPKAEKAAKAEPKAEKPAKAEPKAAKAKKAEKSEAATPVVRAQAKYVRSSARKARLVCDNIRGKSVQDARAILAHTPRAVAKDWSKLLESAVANAEHNHELVGEDLYVTTVTADEGPTIKRFRPRAQGRATKIRKRTSHLTILLTPKD